MAVRSTVPLIIFCQFNLLTGDLIDLVTVFSVTSAETFQKSNIGEQLFQVIKCSSDKDESWNNSQTGKELKHFG